MGALNTSLVSVLRFSAVGVGILASFRVCSGYPTKLMQIGNRRSAKAVVVLRTNLVLAVAQLPKLDIPQPVLFELRVVEWWCSWWGIQPF